MASKLAVQMYTVREHTKTAVGLGDTLRRIRDIGYKAVQISGVDAMGGDRPEVNAALARRMLDDNGLQCIATHRTGAQLFNATDTEIDFHQTLGCDYTAIGGLGSLPKDGYERYRDFARHAETLIARFKAAGIRFGYHNHSYEFFRPERHGQTLQDVLIEEASRELMLELDLYWIEHAGFNCIRILERCHGRVPVIHVKDKEVVEGLDETRMAPIGEGNMDWPAILAAAEAAGVQWYAVEQDFCYRDPFDCLKSSYEFLCSHGL
jgi:sugar phosphate isomerase/epimerase